MSTTLIFVVQYITYLAVNQFSNKIDPNSKMDPNLRQAVFISFCECLATYSECILFIFIKRSAHPHGLHLQPHINAHSTLDILDYVQMGIKVSVCVLSENIIILMCPLSLISLSSPPQCPLWLFLKGLFCSMNSEMLIIALKLVLRPYLLHVFISFFGIELHAFLFVHRYSRSN